MRKCGNETRRFLCRPDIKYQPFNASGPSYQSKEERDGPLQTPRSHPEENVEQAFENAM
jgi:hypothetical protein